MGEESAPTSEDYAPIEINFGDIVQAITDDGRPAGKGVVVQLSENTLFIDDFALGEDGSQHIIPTHGTQYGRIKVIGTFSGGLPKIIEDTRAAMTKLNRPEDAIQRVIKELETEAAKGPVMFTPAKPRTEEEWAKIMDRMRKEHPGFFKDSNS